MNGVALDVDCRTLVGSQIVPYIYEDYVNCENVAQGIMKLFNLDDTNRENLRKKVRRYVTSEFSYQKTIDDWHNSAIKLIETWKNERKDWEIRSF